MARNRIFLFDHGAANILPGTPAHETVAMSNEEEESNSDDEHDITARANPRDYPGTALVLVALAGSSFAWMLYKWLGGKRTTRRAAPDNARATKIPTRQG